MHVVKCPGRDPKWELPNGGGGYADFYNVLVTVVVCDRAVTSVRINTG